MKNDKGITLIILVITIIVLLIIAAVSVAILIGENGIITKSKEAKEAARGSEIKERVEMVAYEDYVKGVKTKRDELINELYKEGKLTEIEYNKLMGIGEKKTHIITIGNITIDFSVLLEDKPFYFSALSEEKYIDLKNKETNLKLTIKNNNDVEYNLIETTYEISLISDNKFTFSIENENAVDNKITKKINGGELINDNITLKIKPNEECDISIEEEITVKVRTIMPDETEINIPITITTVGISWEYACVKDVQKFIAPVDGIYKLEVWGAQGGSYSQEYQGGKGGYATGNITIDKDKELFVYVGEEGKGTGEHKYQVGGYNGGGSAISNDDENTIQSSGGGATHISLTEGLLSEHIDKKENILIVAGAGGGSAGNKAVMAVLAGAGGGLEGGDGGIYYEENIVINGKGYGGTQTEGGNAVLETKGELYLQKGAFGIGATTVYAGGGAGFFGGGVGHSSAGGRVWLYRWSKRRRNYCRRFRNAYI